MKLLSTLLMSSACVFIMPGVALAQASDDTPAQNGDGDIVVTGSRIASHKGGPNPVTTVNADQLSTLSPESLPAGLAKLPIFQPVKSTNSASDGGYQPTGNYLDLWGLGPVRTLVLFDGRRVSPTYVEGTTDINTLPQMLVKRVEVVTGGASAVYGSDAVAGVANIILENEFKGLKVEANAGLSTYGDGESIRAGIAHGFNIGERAHFEWSAEYFRRASISGGDRAFSGISASIVGNGTAASPLEQVTNSRLNSSAFGGLVTNGPFAGQQFLADGTLAPFDRGRVTQSSGISIGGDGTYRRPTNLLPSVNTAQVFGRLDYDLGSNITAFVQGNYARTNTLSHNQNLISTASSNGITIYSGNAFLRPEYQARLTETNTASFNLARYNEDFGNLLSLHNRTTAFSVTAGLSGSLFGDFSWDAWYTHGEGRISQFTANNTNTQRLYAALDAVRDPASGNIVCRVTLTAPGAYPGCVPMNVLGVNTASPEAIAYVNGDTAWTATNKMDDIAATLTGTLVDGWAGPIKVALGGEYRRQSLRQTSTVADNSFNRQYLRVGLNGSTPSAGTQLWTKNVSAPTYGAQSVYEGNLELNVPLLRDLPLARSLSLSAAGRLTHYSISGAARTWRLGLDWQPFEDLRLHATRSRDIRAPTLYELYQGETRTISGYNDYLTNANGQILNLSRGNPDLVPEVARNVTVGAAYRPSWLPGLDLSIDYFDVRINNAISSINGMSASTQRICIASGGTSPLCDLVERPFPITNTTLANAPTLNIKQNENVAFVHARGFVVSGRYIADLANVASSLNGTLGLDLQWTHQPLLENQSLPGTQVTNTAGTALAPADRISTTLSYGLDRLHAAVTFRYFSPFRYNSDPTLIVAQPRSNAYTQTDINLGYDFDRGGQGVSAFINVNNLFNAHGGLYATSASNPGLLYPATPFADQIGRYVRVGFKMSID
jgi:outer membrane receptor protein involved in Fe transport